MSAKFKKIIKVIIFSILIIITLCFLGVVVFIKTSPQFGQVPEGKYLEEISKSENYKNKIFVNAVETNLDVGFGDMMKLLPKFLFGGVKDKEPKGKLPTKFANNNDLQGEKDTLLYVTWYGHSAFLLEIEGKRLLIDPMLGSYSAPVSFFSKRFPYEQPIDISLINNIDAVILSHDHYDHLDYSSILTLKDKVEHFYMPLGVGAHLRHWGIDTSKITELDWWNSANFKDLTFICTPSRHFSGRGTNDRFKTLWASWVIKGEKHNVFFSGDGGYWHGFKDIGDKYGPFDFTMMECGQYNELWESIHMMPKQTVQAHIDVRGKVLMPIHWGAFSLSMHSWTEPVERITKEAQRRNVKIITPYIGQRFLIGEDFPNDYWWTKID